MNNPIPTRPSTYGSRSLQQFMRQHPLISFFLLTYTLSWITWLPQLAATQGFLNSSVSPYFHILGALGPMLAALIVTSITEGRAGIQELARRMFRWRVNIVWHLIAWLSMVLLFAIAAVVARIAWGAWPGLSLFGLTEEYPQLPVLVYWLANLIFYGWGEETGWRGFALPRLQKDHHALVATFIVSIFWALYHLPLFWFVDGFMGMGLGGAMGWYFSILLGAVIMTWLYNSTQGSILIVAVFHATVNIVFNSPFSTDFATVLGMLMTFWGIAMLFVNKPVRASRPIKHLLG